MLLCNWRVLVVLGVELSIGVEEGTFQLPSPGR